ncbi:TetR/AcrR family transcriptional regulator C-terminal domain-containing protein [Natronosporangium hydrolyticum]|uniref:TetR/AcrR family transcriptional regulator C-terminal domain-containing protein n=1 Tax=Natronosporangium hydrolyticum TaxID=2811111 RepID=A0A895YL95_9ACTN|nr:TetR/AcrR family transcriptional regulator [Natronosporangium hydrolyticum]QSB16745.1 TetR/AcrR family transcriptional regulator C-terminal domain-containing protein [Natronosporangium hydrolyticum]
MASCEQCGAPLTTASRGRRRHYCSRSCQARAYRARAKTRGAAHDEVTTELTAPDPAATGRSAARAGASRGESASATEGLSVPRIVAVAIRLADAHGLDGLAMRQVAAELGVATMSLYHHVRGKDELVELMVEAVFRDGADSPAAARSGSDGADPAPGAWRAGLESWARREWDLLGRHPWVLRAVTGYPPVLPPGVLADVGRLLTALVDAGLDPVTAHQAFQSASGLAEGLALLRAGIAEADRRGLTAGWRAVELPALLAQLDPETRPVQAALVGSMDATMDVEQMFEFGLARLLDGIEQFVESDGGGPAEPTATPRRSAT